MRKQCQHNILNIELGSKLFYHCPVISVMYCIIQSFSVSLKPSMNDYSDLTNITLRKFSISAYCSTVILVCGTCLIASHNFCLKYQRQESVKKQV